MNALIEKLTGMDKLSDQVIATDFLISAKAGIQNYAVAITETTSDEIRETLKRQLNDTIDAHEAITNYMIKRGFYNAYDLHEQYKVDMQVTETALSLAEKMIL
ncbi:spore coat protein [Clostridium swellfunianum]|uniref:spore coat protein n=1 Tax=Clostridium swellfunianum TaxID=1367462 RepID=UPI00202F0E13|nr:spore coat protein [Clostridium swellfunianum]